jgi:hypothetical protein
LCTSTPWRSHLIKLQFEDEDRPQNILEQQASFWKAKYDKPWTVCLHTTRSWWVKKTQPLKELPKGIRAIVACGAGLCRSVKVRGTDVPKPTWRLCCFWYNISDVEIRTIN